MLDIRLIRTNPKDLDKALAKRGHPLMSDALLAHDHKHRAAVAELQTYQERRHEIAKEFQACKKEGKDTSHLVKEAEINKERIAAFEILVHTHEADLKGTLSSLPNTPLAECPLGSEESHNVEVRRVGTPKTYDFSVKSHDELGTSLKLMDFERASKLSGSRFVVLYGALARLERALATWMLDVHTKEFGYLEVYPPLMTRDEAMFGTGQLPKAHADMFQTTSGHWLIPTSEVVLTNLVAGDTLEEETLPLRFAAYTPCFRSEAGAAGKDTRGMIRQHQFGKVELVSITSPEHTKNEHERMTNCAEEILKRLDLPYRVMLLCTGDMGFCSEKTYDLEVWLPHQQTYREISSCSRFGDFHARRMNTRFRSQGKNQFVHTLNGSALAVGRTLVAILENYQNADGTIEVPEVLRSYMGAQVIG